jgi:hypothetical protein
MWQVLRVLAAVESAQTGHSLSRCDHSCRLPYSDVSGRMPGCLCSVDDTRFCNSIVGTTLSEVQSVAFAV